jgi:hypothetical protein
MRSGESSVGAERALCVGGAYCAALQQRCQHINLPRHAPESIIKVSCTLTLYKDSLSTFSWLLPLPPSFVAHVPQLNRHLSR